MSEPTHREAFDYKPDRDTQGTALEKLREYATTSLSREDSGMMRCATFDAFEYICGIISSIEKIPVTRVYPGLRMIGYDHRYTNMKNNNPDALWDIGDVANRCMVCGDPGVIPFVSSSTGLFSDVRSSSYRVNEQVISIAGKDAQRAGIKLSELNLFNALEGLNILVNDDQKYFVYRENVYIEESLAKFSFIKRHLTAKRATLLKVLGD